MGRDNSVVQPGCCRRISFLILILILLFILILIAPEMIKSKRKTTIKSRGSSPVDETEIVDRRSRRRRNVVQLLFARIGRGNDDAHGLLIEAFETAVALEILEMAADGAVAHELVALLPRDERGG